MARINVIEIEQEARRLRAEDLRRREPIVGPRLGLCARMAAASFIALAAAAEAALRRLFSWNPQAHGRLLKGH